MVELGIEEASETTAIACAEERSQRPRSSLRRWRGWVLGAVYVLMAAHVAHWLLAGRTLGPVVFSESMYTLELGKLNPGFLFFLVSLGVTVVAGRFLCGWLCHMAGLQELCAWILRKVGVHPRPFRSRLLGYVPVGLAIYMFVWPSISRELVIPALERAWPAAVGIVKAVPDFPGMSNAILTDNLWSPLPGILVCVVFLVVSGFVTVAFLGARGLCRYGCPYGGFFLPLEQLAPGRIAVDPERCDRCGYCNAVCTNGVDVLGEVQAYGAIVDKNCVRSLDCVSACPPKALSFRFTKPAILARRDPATRVKRRYDTTWAEELLLLGVFGATLLVTRGLYGTIPLLMAVSIAVCAAFVAWKALRLLRGEDERFCGLQLKRSGSLRPGGVAFLSLGGFALLLLLHSAAVRALLWRADRDEAGMRVTREAVFSGEPDAIPESERATARELLGLYRLASRFDRGGIALGDTPEALVRESWLSLVAGEPARAEAALERLMGEPAEAGTPLQRILGSKAPDDALAADLARILLLQGREADAVAYLQAVVGKNPAFAACPDLLVDLHLRSGRVAEARAVYEELVAEAPRSVHHLVGLASILLAQEDFASAREHLEVAAEEAPGNVQVLARLAFARFRAGDIDGAVEVLGRAAEADPASAESFRAAAAEMLAQAHEGT